MPLAPKSATSKPTHNWPKTRTQYAGSGWAWQKLRAAVLKRDFHICKWCGFNATTADHVKARAFGGTDTLDNLVAACARCNQRRAHEQSKEGQRRKAAGLGRSHTPLPRAVTQW